MGLAAVLLSTTATQAIPQQLPASRLLAAEELQARLSVDLDKPVHAGTVSVGVSGNQMSVREVWRTRDDRQMKYDVAQAYARYFCGSSNVLNTVGAWKPGFGIRGDWFTYDDTVTFDCLRPDAARTGVAPGGLAWSKQGASAWLLPYSRGEDVVRAELRFGTLRPNEATTLVQLALYHSAAAYRAANCPSQLLPRAVFLETTPSQAGSQSDAVVTSRFACD